ncbi:mitochondrial distribution and morphology protein 10 [Suhomyces tanzawaensis NRRL Y-17324]|uniref:Mitochondrial distribution and morphology protein 10 n=1 Tax=Suhomyces tanzawaensis NRRL Y-17324 TaxID=984487 RepID=A0A1E4SLX2_9ASCO|nr:mitochondrial distribution and morphology protein 10 [Suhomyces tanzawaensis NRRL Y-17324]ODV80510.1 mitochondrial distribution and morphology protein 10 [Suhomyces tanzawaensis NRRL Y-17324]
MYTYMEYLQKCFYKSTNWNEDNIFSNINATSQALLEFPIPKGVKLDSSSKTTEHLASSFTLSNYYSINGSVAYLYSSKPLVNTMGTKEVSLQDAIAGFKTIEPNITNKGSSNQGTHSSKDTHNHSLLYGRMYFPGLALEAMIIKKITQHTQLLIKCINNPHVNSNGTMIVYLQNNTPQFLRELIYSTNEALIGFRCLYNFGDRQSSNMHTLMPKFDNSVFSLGTELWYAARTMSPGLSTAFRYSTRSTSTGKPLTMTLAVNPILGHISSTYTVKTSVSSTFCSRYDFNFFSYASNLSLGFELYNYSNLPELSETTEKRLTNNTTTSINPPIIRKGRNNFINPIQNSDNYYHINPTLIPSKVEKNSDRHSNAEPSRESVTTSFQKIVNQSDFSSVTKLATSTNDKLLRLLWEGRVKDFLVSTGVRVSLNPVNYAPEISKFGISFSYAC